VSDTGLRAVDNEGTHRSPLARASFDTFSSHPGAGV